VEVGHRLCASVFLHAGSPPRTRAVSVYGDSRS
jgi:hypothetical protein